MTKPPEVVLVDDDIDHAIIVRTVLASVAPDIPVRTLTDPHEVDTRLRQVEQGALLLIDRLLGAVESISFIAPLCADRPDLNVVLMSSSLSEPDAVRALDAGASEAIEKPGSIEGWRVLLGRLTAGGAAGSAVA